MGYDVFAAEADAVGVDGVLVVDDPPEEAGPLHASLAARGLDQVFLIAPNSPAGRIADIGKLASGFVYYVSVKGVTGDKQLDTTEVGNKVARFRDKLPVPVGVGFGIRTPDAAAGVARICDAVIVGSVIIDIVEQHQADVDAGSDDVRVLVSRFRDALDEARSRAA
jgi:tryptophan synthase alpha chain